MTSSHDSRVRASRASAIRFRLGVGALCGVLAASVDAKADDATPGSETTSGETAILDPIRVERDALTAFDPVGGYLADRSATPTRMNIPIDDLPMPIQVIPSEVLDDTGASRVDDALDYTAGTQKTNTFGNTGDGILLRGFRATFAEDGAVDGGFVTSSRGARDSAIVERVEVLRGPASALYGEGSPGGIVNVVTKRPQPETFAETEMTLSSFERFRQTFDANTTFGETAAWRTRISGAAEYFDSFRDRVEGHRQVVAPAVQFQPNEDVTFNLRGEYQREERPFDRGVPVDADGNLLSDREQFLGDPDDGDTITQNGKVQAEGSVALSDDWTLKGFGSWSRSSLEGSQTEPRLLAPFSLPASVLGVPLVANETLLRIQRARDQQTRFWTGRAEVEGTFATGPLRHRTLVSMEARDVRRLSELDQTRVLAQPDLVDLTAPAIDTPELPFAQQSDVENEVTNVGLVVFDHITPIDPVKILAGGRLDFVDQTARTTSNGTTTRTTLEETQFSPTIGGVFEPVSWGSVFARYSQSFQANTAVAADGEPIEPQEGESIEAGFRVNLRDGALRATVTAFSINLENEAVQDSLNNFAVPATRDSRGVELSLQGALTPQLSIVANYTFTDAEIDDLPNVPDGQTPAGVPSHAANAFLTYAFEGGGLSGLSLNGGVLFNGERPNALPTFVQTPPGLPDLTVGGNELDAYTRVDVGLGYEIQNWLTASARIENVLDTDYERPSTPGFTLPQPGRLFTAGLKLRF